jgi:hypothetical protein
VRRIELGDLEALGVERGRIAPGDGIALAGTELEAGDVRAARVAVDDAADVGARAPYQLQTPGL